MSAPPFSWPRLIAEIPTDVVFHVVDNGQVHDVKAHKMILGMVSPIFNTMFYSTQVGDKTAREIKIEETTQPAFQIMIDAIYDYEAIEDNLKDKSVREVFDVVNLIERYQIGEFTEIVQKLLSNYPVTEDTVLEVASEAMEFNILFQKESQLLLLVCAKFLQPKLKDVKSIFKYVKENEDEKEVVATLLALMDEMAAGMMSARTGKKSQKMSSELDSLCLLTLMAFFLTQPNLPKYSKRRVRVGKKYSKRMSSEHLPLRSVEHSVVIRSFIASDSWISCHAKKIRTMWRPRLGRAPTITIINIIINHSHV